MRAYFFWLSKVVTMIVLLLIFIPALLVAVVGAVGAANQQGKRDVVDKRVGVVELTGMIENSKDILKQLHKFADDEDIKGIVLRVNSPGGAVAPSQAIYSAVSRLKERKPVVVAMGAVAASGGLYAALGASRVYAQPGTITGSIGVILQLPNFEKIAEKVGFRMITIKSGKLKDAGNSFGPMTAEARAYFTATAERAHVDFMQAVADGRGIELSQVREFADGRILLGSTAKELNLVDDFGDVYEASRAVFELLGSPLEDGKYPKLVYPDEKFEELRKIFRSVASIGNRVEGHLQLMYLMQ